MFALVWLGLSATIGKLWMQGAFEHAEGHLWPMIGYVGIALLGGFLGTIVAAIALAVLGASGLVLGSGFYQIWPLGMFSCLIGFIDSRWTGLGIGALASAVAGILYAELRFRWAGIGTPFDTKLALMEKIPAALSKKRK